MRPLSLKPFTTAWAVFCSLSLFALPQDAKIISGQADLRQTASGQLQITTGDKTIINWKDFSIAKGEQLHFLQPSSKSAVLNRVKGGDISSLAGQLLANGKVYLINPNGVIIGKDACIQTAHFLASTLDLSDEAFLLEQDLLFQGDSKEAIINYGTIQALDGNITLIGRVLDNQGSLSAPHGKVSLAAGQEILLKPDDIAILTIRPQIEPDGTILHAGYIQALLTDLQAEGRARAYGINIQGSVLALNTVESGGKIYLKAGSIAIAPEGVLQAPSGSIAVEATAGMLYMEGTLQAKQGTVHINNTAPNALTSNLGTLDVSGPQGGEIHIDTSNCINSGHILALGTEGSGGSIAIHTHGPYIETSQGLLATSGQQKGGSISLLADATLFSSGTHLSQGDVGGEVVLLSPQLTLVSAQIDTSGTSQGGSVFIGGGAHGALKGPLNATTTHLSGDTRLSAGVREEQGDGGTIVVWSDNRTICYGTIEANAGALKGDGGWIEISSKQELHCSASLSAAAPNGAPGTVLFDPGNITIDTATGAFPQYAFIDPNAGSGTGFGTVIVPLSTGNVVITKPGDNAAAPNAGAVYLYNGATAALISTLTGSSSGDDVGLFGVTPLTGNGNYVIVSAVWDNGPIGGAGAVTWGNGVTGVQGVISATNSLVGSTHSDNVGFNGITPLANGNYVVISPSWTNAQVATAGAVTWANGNGTTTGAVSAANSLVGSTAADQVGSAGIIQLTNGNYVVKSPSWSNGGHAGAGAATWGSETAGVAGAITSANSIIGSTANDHVGNSVTALTNGNFVLVTSAWTNAGVSSAGAVTWASGVGSTTGAVSSSNSLVGSTASDQIGFGGITELANGNYVVASSSWTNGGVSLAGAVTWANGAGGTTGAVSAANSLVGSTASDRVGSTGISALTNGNYVVISPLWNGAGSQRGAASFAMGNGSTIGAVSALNSLVGSTNADQVSSSGITQLTNGNYVVKSPNWSTGGHAAVGAATWGSETAGIVGAITSSNSIIGSTANDNVGMAVTALNNGNYVVASPNWTSAGVSKVGAATWASGNGSTTGAVALANSIVGSTASDQIGSSGVMALGNGHYIVRSPHWTNAGQSNCGAITWGSGTSATSAVVSAANSLVTTQVSKAVGTTVVLVGSDRSNFVNVTPTWSNTLVAPVVSSAGAATWGSGLGTTVGSISPSNSLIGTLINTQIGSNGVTVLSNGNYVVLSPGFRILTGPSLSITVGGVTWGNGQSGVIGSMSAANSLVGASSGDQIGTITTGNGVFEIGTTGNFYVRADHWHNGSLFMAGAVVWGNGNQGGTVGPVTTQNSVVGTIASSGLGTVVTDLVNSTLIVPFANENSGSGAVLASLTSPSQVGYASGGANMSISPTYIDQLLSSGTAVVLQANNDILLSTPLTSTGTGALTLTAGKSVTLGANLNLGNGSLTVLANVPLSSGLIDADRLPGDALLTVADNVTLNTGTGNLTLSLLNGEGKTYSSSGDLTLGNSVTLQASGPGAITITAQENNIVLGTSAQLQTQDGTLQLSAGSNIEATNLVTLQTLGVGELIFICDALFPTSPQFGNGSANFSQAVLNTAGGKLLIYTAQRALNTLPVTINNVLYIEGPEFVNSITEKWGVYYPNSSGIPFTVFYKETAPPPPPPPPGPPPPPAPPGPPPSPHFFVNGKDAHAAILAAVEPFHFWMNPWYSDTFFAANIYPPYLTPTIKCQFLPPLVQVPQEDVTNFSQ